MLFTDLQRLKAVLDVDPEDPVEDKKFSIWISTCSSWIQEWLNRPDMSKRERTEYYSGTGSPRLALRNRPVYADPVPQAWVDDRGYFGAPSAAFTDGNGNSQTLVYGTDFALEVMEEGVPVRSGILWRIDSVWPRKSYRQQGYLFPYQGGGAGNVKVTYTAGYTVDTLPEQVRAACELLVGMFRFVFPLGLPLTGDTYGGAGISIELGKRNYLMSLIKPMLTPYMNWRW